MKNKKEEPEYWHCIIGSAKRSELSFGADYPMRQSVKGVYESITGQSDYTCSSGWGMKQDMVDVINKIQNLKSLSPEKYEKLKKQIMKMDFTETKKMKNEKN